MENKYEIILLGSGPISLLNAFLLLQARTTKSVTLIDSGNQIGGAWYSDISKLGYEIECGCHIWSYSPIVYDFIQNELNIKLAPFKSPPVFNKGKINLPYHLKNTLDSYKYLFKYLFRFNKKKLTEIKGSPKLFFNIFNKNYLYPEHGSPELVNALLKKLKSNEKFKIILNENIKSIDIDSVVTAYTGEKSYTCNKIYISSTSFIKQITSGDETINLTENNSQINYIHFLISLSKQTKQASSYIRLTNDPIIHRVADISYQTDYKENLILFGIKQSGYDTNTESQIIAHLKTYLIKQNIIDDSIELELVKKHIYPTFYINEPIRNDINDIDQSKLELSHSTDLMYGFHNLLKRHKLI